MRECVKCFHYKSVESNFGSQQFKPLTHFLTDRIKQMTQPADSLSLAWYNNQNNYDSVSFKILRRPTLTLSFRLGTRQSEVVGVLISAKCNITIQLL